MKFLLDTHTLIWYANNDEQLSSVALKHITDTNSSCYVSIASLWEIAIKSSLGKLDLKTGIEEFGKLVLRNGISISAISLRHLKVYGILPLHHKDPFDRILIAQSIAESIPIITKDKLFKLYTSNLIW